MVGKITFFFLVLFICKGYAVTEVRLADRDLSYIRHSHMATSISIPKALWDTMTNCHVIYPSRVMYEVFPLNRIPSNSANVFFLDAVEPFRSCGIGFRDVGPEFSGTYELLSTVVHTMDSNRVSLTRQRFHLTVTESDFD